MVSYFPQEINPMFNLPDLMERVPRMTASHSFGVKNAGWAPNILGRFKVDHRGIEYYDGCFGEYSHSSSGGLYGSYGTFTNVITFDASKSWGGYANGVSTISAANLTMCWVIKY